MLIITILVSIGIIVSLVLSAYRFMIDYRLRQLEKDTTLASTTRRKLFRIKHKEQEEHVHILLINALLIGLLVIGLTISLLLMDGKVAKLSAQTERLTDEVFALKQEQKRLITKTPIKDYPDEGIGLADNPWDKLFDDSEKAAVQSDIESKVSEQIVPYFGLSTFVLSIDVPSKTLSISLIGDVVYSSNQKTIKKNIKAFVKEAEPIAEVNQIQFQIDEVSKNKNATVYSCTYGRDDVKESFELLNEKVSGEKGE